MQQQLQDLQPELIQTSEETEKLMVKIEKDTVEAEAKKEVCSNNPSLKNFLLIFMLIMFVFMLILLVFMLILFVFMLIMFVFILLYLYLCVFH